MKIGIVSPYYMDRYGGVQSLVLATRNNLIDFGHDVKIIAPKPKTSNNKQDESHLVNIGSSVEIKLGALSTTFPLAISINTKEVDQLLGEEKFDVLHVHEPWLPMLGGQIIQRADCPVVGTLHANKPDNFSSRAFGATFSSYIKSTTANIDILTAPSKAAGTFGLGFIDKKVEIVPNGIDVGIYSPDKVKKYPELNNGKKTILFIGRLEKRKGVSYLLKAFRLIAQQRSDTQLIIAGSGPLEKSLKDFARRHKLKNTHFLGFVSDEEKLQLLKLADVYCSPALFGESFGIVLLEAMAMKTIAVGGNNPGYSSVLNGYGRVGLVDPEAVKDFANRLELFIDDKKIQAQWTSWAKKEIKSYDYPVVSKKFEKLYHRAIDGQK